jgi:hypothetical protein
MTRHAAQRGITMWGVLFIGALIVVSVLLFLKLLPPYLENGKVRTALENVGKQPGSAAFTRAEVVNAIERRFEIDDVTRVDLAKDLSLERSADGRGKVIRIQYDVVVPLVYNLSALIQFDNSVEAGRVSE